MTKIVLASVRHHAFGDDGECVAIIDLSAAPTTNIDSVLNRAYRDTNTIDCPWWENDGIEMVGRAKTRGGCRSTSVLDRVHLEFEDGTLEVYEVSPIGFTKVFGFWGKGEKA